VYVNKTITCYDLLEEGSRFTAVGSNSSLLMNFCSLFNDTLTLKNIINNKQLLQTGQLYVSKDIRMFININRQGFILQFFVILIR